MIAIMGSFSGSTASLHFCIPYREWTTLPAEVILMEKSLLQWGIGLGSSVVNDMGFIFQQMYMMKNLTIFGQ